MVNCLCVLRCVCEMRKRVLIKHLKVLLKTRQVNTTLNTHTTIEIQTEWDIFKYLFKQALQTVIGKQILYKFEKSSTTKLKLF